MGKTKERKTTKKETTAPESSQEETVVEHEVRKVLAEALKREAQRYAEVMRRMEADVPVEALCLRKRTESLLLEHGILRVFELLDFDLTEIEWLDAVARRDLTARLHQFLSMSA